MTKEQEAIASALKALTPDITVKKSKGGTVMEIDGSAYWNLEGALIDLKRTKADKGCIKTIERVQSQILKAEDILRKYLKEAS